MDIKNKCKEIISKVKNNKVNILFFLIFIAISVVIMSNTIVVGSSLNENSEFIRIAVTIIAIIEITLKKIIEKNNYRLFQNVLEVFIVIFIVAAVIPLIFETYISFHASLNLILKYLSVFLVYIVARDLIQYDVKYKKRFLHIIVISGLITAIIGIDNLTTNFLKNILLGVGNTEQLNSENRMIGAFFYANTFGIAVALTAIIAITIFLEEKNKFIKNIYSGIIFILMSALILSYSRGTLVLTALFLIILFISIKNKTKKIEYIKLLIIECIATLIYTTVFTSVQLNENHIIVWLMAIVESIIVCLIANTTKKLDSYLEKLNNKKIIIVAIVILVSAILFIAVGLQISEPLILFEEGKGNTVYEYRIRKVEKNAEYKFKFDIDAITNIDENYEINIMEQSPNEETIREDNYIIGNFRGEKEYNFQTSDEAYLIVIQIINRNPHESQKVTINKVIVNDEILPLKYKFLPINLVDKVKNISLTDGSLYSRGVFVRDSLKLIEKNLIIGYGGEAFNYLGRTVQDFYYASAETHCYPIQVLLEQGIIGFIAYIGILGYLIKNMIKGKEKNLSEIGAILALGILAIHSMMDFDMTFLYIVVVFYLLIAIVTTKQKKEYDKKLWSRLIEFIILVVLIVSIVGNIIVIKNVPMTKWEEISTKIGKEDNIINELLEFRKKERFYNYSNQLSTLMVLIKTEIKRGNFSHAEDLYEIIEEEYCKVDANINSYKLNMAREIIQVCDEKYQNKGIQEYNDIAKKMREFIINRTIELEEIWNDNTKLRLKKDELENVKENLRKLRIETKQDNVNRDM